MAGDIRSSPDTPRGKPPAKPALRPVVRRGGAAGGIGSPMPLLPSSQEAIEGASLLTRAAAMPPNPGPFGSPCSELARLPRLSPDSPSPGSPSPDRPSPDRPRPPSPSPPHPPLLFTESPTAGGAAPTPPPPPTAALYAAPNAPREDRDVSLSLFSRASACESSELSCSPPDADARLETARLPPPPPAPKRHVPLLDE
jgi:hypothetical protein